jgi:hypothetical protein
VNLPVNCSRASAAASALVLEMGSLVKFFGIFGPKKTVQDSSRLYKVLNCLELGLELS